MLTLKRRFRDAKNKRVRFRVIVLVEYNLVYSQHLTNHAPVPRIN